MLNRFLTLILALLLTGITQAEWTSPHDLKLEEEAPNALIPFPREVNWEDDELELPPAHGLALKGKAAKGNSIRIAWKKVQASAKGKGKQNVTVNLKNAGDKLDKEASEEGYILNVGKKSINIYANSTAGFFYGLQTLSQLIHGKKSIPQCEIKDWPAFRFRGYMQDSGRNFRTIERLKKEIDLAARLKVNFFHWHLTDHHGWRVECKKYPILNDPKTRERDLTDTYSYAEIKDLFKYAKERNITIMPELDMPGHSSYFPKAFGFKMHTPEGMKICAELITEFCKEIPKDLCPYFSFGADEVRIPNAEEFVNMACKVLAENDRTHVQWAGGHDLKVHPKSVRKRWAEGFAGCIYSLTNIDGPTLDYAVGYCNVYPPAMMVRRYFFMRPCGAGKGDENSMGVVLGIWPDGKVDNKEWIPGMCNMWPSMCAMAERGWVGGASDGDAFIPEMPAPDTEAGKAYRLFEERMADIRKSIFKDEDFPMWTESNVKWKLVEPVAAEAADSTREAVLKGKLDGLKTKDVYCANLYFRTRDGSGNQGMYRKASPGVHLWAVTEITVKKEGKYPFMIGFDAPERSNRRWTGVPQNGKWSNAGTRIWVNGKEIHNQRVYKLAGQRERKAPWWGFHEPLDLEEIWWMLDPTELQLKKGKNTIIIEQPYIGHHLDWSIGFIPLFQHK